MGLPEVWLPSYVQVNVAGHVYPWDLPWRPSTFEDKVGSVRLDEELPVLQPSSLGGPVDPSPVSNLRLVHALL